MIQYGMPESRSPPIDPYMKRTSSAECPFSACQTCSGSSRKNLYQANHAPSDTMMTRTISVVMSHRGSGLISMIMASSERLQILDECVLVGGRQRGSVRGSFVSPVAVGDGARVIAEVRTAVARGELPDESDVHRIVVVVAAKEDR